MLLLTAAEIIRLHDEKILREAAQIEARRTATRQRKIADEVKREAQDRIEIRDYLASL